MAGIAYALTVFLVTTTTLFDDVISSAESQVGVNNDPFC